MRKTIFRISGAFLILAGLILALVSATYLLFSALGIVFIALSFMKEPEPKPAAEPVKAIQEPEPKPVPRTTTETFKLLAPENVERFARLHAEERDENPDYFLSKTELLEEFYEERVYKMTYFDAEIKGNEVWCDDIHLGHIKRALAKNETAEVVLCGGPFKYVGEEEVEKDEFDPWLFVEVTKKA